MLKLPNTMKTLTTLPPDAEDITDIMTLDTKDMTNNIMTNNITQCPADIPDININPKDNDKITPIKDHENITNNLTQYHEDITYNIIQDDDITDNTTQDCEDITDNTNLHHEDITDKFTQDYVDITDNPTKIMMISLTTSPRITKISLTT